MDAKMKTRTEALRETGASSFFPVKGALTHHLRSRRWYPSRWSGSCALRGGCGFCGSLQTMPHPLPELLSLPVQPAVVVLYLQNDEVAPCHPIPPIACENLPPAALSQIWTELTARPFSFSEKKQKQVYAVSGYIGKDGEKQWQFIIWKQRS